MRQCTHDPERVRHQRAHDSQRSPAYVRIAKLEIRVLVSPREVRDRKLDREFEDRKAAQQHSQPELPVALAKQNVGAKSHADESHLFLLFTFFVKEEMGLIGVGFGAYVLLGKRDWKLGLGVLLGSLAIFEFTVQLAIPYFARGNEYAYFKLRYADVGGTPLGIMRTLVTDPLRIARALAHFKKVYFVIAIFGPVLGLSALAGWAALLPLPTLGYLLLSNYEAQFSFTNQYAAPLIPLVIGTSIIAMARLPKAARPPVGAAILVSSLVFSWAFGDLPLSRQFDPALFQTQAPYSTFLPHLAQIPTDARVSAEYR